MIPSTSSPSLSSTPSTQLPGNAHAGRPERQDTDPDVIDLLDYLEVIVKRRNMICLFTMGAAVIALLISMTMTHLYSSTALILPPQQDSGMVSMMGMIGGGGAMSSLASDLLGKGGPSDLYAKILESEAIKDVIIDRFNVINEYKTKYRVFAYKLLDKMVKIEIGKKDGIISITVDDKDPKRASDMANAYVDEVGKLATRLGIASAQNNRSYVEERLTKVKVDFDKASDSLKEFQAKYKAMDISEQVKGTIKGVAELEGRLAADEVRLAGLRRVFTDSSQDVRNQHIVISNVKAQIAKYEGARQGGALPGIGSVPVLGQRYLRLMREFKLQETLLELLTKQLELSKLSEAKNVDTIQVIQKARESDKSLKPNKRKIVMVASAVAFIVSILIAFILEMGDDQKERSRKLFRQLFAIRSNV